MSHLGPLGEALLYQFIMPCVWHTMLLISYHNCEGCLMLAAVEYLGKYLTEVNSSQINAYDCTTSPKYKCS